MIDYKIDQKDNEGAKLKISGQLDDLLAEMNIFVKMIINGITDKFGSETGKEFSEIFIYLLMDDHENKFGETVS